MTTLSRPETGSLESLVAQVVDEFLARQQRGEQPDVEEYAGRHPEHAAVLRDVLASLRIVGLSGAAGAVALGPGEDPLAGCLGDFRLLREIGRGGMGVVYEAEQISLRRRVALKVLPFAAMMDARQLQRFKNEAQAAAQLHHTNIVPVYAVGCERSVHFYAMQYIEGQSLAEEIAALRANDERRMTNDDSETTTPHVPQPEGTTGIRPSTSGLLSSLGIRHSSFFRAVAQLGIQAAEALDYAHQHGIIHRDIKPANLLVEGEPGASAAGVRLWITDFGLAQVQNDTRLTMTGDLVGTLRYMSPEQALAKRVVVDHRTDIYSLGATLYELVTLEPTFSGTDRNELLRQIAFEEPRAPRRRNKAIPVELETIVVKAMEKNPADRYTTALEVAEDLRRFVHDEPIRARRASLFQQARKWARRHRALVWSAAIILCVIVLMLAGTFGWVARDLAARRLIVEEAVEQALKESQDWQQKRKLFEALSAGQRAEGIVAGGPASERLRQRVRARVADLELLEKLDNVRLEMTALKGKGFDHGRADSLYGETFRQWSLDFERLSSDDAAERIRLSTVPIELAATLDQWATVRRMNRGYEDGIWKKLLRVARVVDPDVWRSQVREALEQTDLKAAKILFSKLLAELAEPARIRNLPPSSLYGLSLHLELLKVTERVEPFLREAQRQYPNDFWTNFALAVFLAQLQPPQVDEAIRFYTAAVALRPQSPAAHNNLGSVLEKKGRLDDAIAEYREAIRVNKDSALPRYNLGYALRSKGLIAEAIPEFREAVRIDSGYVDAHTVLGITLQDLGQLDEAIAVLREAVRIRPDAGTHNNLGKALKANDRLDEALAEWRKILQFENNAWAHTNIGDGLRSKGQLDEAIAEYREALRLDKDYARAHSNLGNALADEGQLDDAIAEFREAIRLNKDYAQPHFNLATVLKEKGQLHEAIAEFREAIRIKPDYANAHHGLGQMLRLKGQIDDAIAEIRTAIKLTATNLAPNSDLKADLALAYLDVGAVLCDVKRDYDGAIAAFREALRIKPDCAEAHHNLGVALEGKGWLEDAAAKFQEALRIKNDYADAHKSLGTVLIGLGRLEDAVRELREAVRLKPAYADAKTNLRLAERLLELDRKLHVILSGKQQPTNTAERIALAELCQMCKKRYLAALRYYEEAFSAEPKLAADQPSTPRYNAACAAALAGSGQGEDADKLEPDEYARLRRQALDWLRTDLAAWHKALEGDRSRAAPAVREQMQHWLQDTDFTAVRGLDTLAKLPESERADWTKFWQDVAALGKQAAEATGSHKAPELSPELVPLPKEVPPK